MAELLGLINSGHFTRPTAQAIGQLSSAPPDPNNSLEQLGYVRQIVLNLPTTISMLIQEMNAMEHNSTTVQTQQHSAHELLSSSHQTALTQLQNLQNSYQQLQSSVQSSNSSGANKHRSILDHKALLNQAKLASDKHGFRNWNDKLINSFAAAVPGIRFVLEKINESVDNGTIGMADSLNTVAEIKSWYGGLVHPNGHNLDNSPTLNWNQVSEDLNYVLVEKCEGDAMLQIKTQPRGQGIMAYIAIYKWFTGTTGLGLAARATRIMHPQTPKKEEDIIAAIDRWNEQMKLLANYGASHELPNVFKIAALKTLMNVGKAKEYFETIESTKDFDSLLKLCREYGTKRKLEGEKGDPMDVGNVENNEEEEYEDGWYWDPNTWEWTGPIDAVGKGKSLGKGGKSMGKGNCYNCGKPGHIARNCPKGKGKGKGFQGNCYNCGGKGHTAKNCPTPKGKGKGGRINEVDGEEGSPAPSNSDENNPQQEGGGEGRQIGELGGIELCAVDCDGWQIAKGKGNPRITTPPPIPVASRPVRKPQRKLINWCCENPEECDHSMGPINAVGKNEWEKISVTADSGAVDSVAPKSTAPGIKIRETAASRAGMHYTAANGSQIRNFGEKKIIGKDGTGRPLSITMQCADVRKPLASVSKMAEFGNKIVFDEDGSYIENKTTKLRTPLRKERGVYVFDLWIPKLPLIDSGNARDVQMVEEQTRGSRNSDFNWLDNEAM